MSDNKLYITRKQILEAYANNTLDNLFNEKTKMIEQIERAKEAKKSLLDMIKNPSKVDLLLKMLQENDKD